jgi:galactokinase
MKKYLILLALAVGVTTLASMKAAGSSSEFVRNIAADRREARACEVLLRKMSSPNADTWQNRMRAWPCIQRAKAMQASTLVAKK